LGARRRLLAASLIMASALAALVGGVLPPEMAFPLAAMGMVLVGLVPLRDAYQNIDWPVVVLLGAMIPVGKALETTGGAGFVAAAISALAWEVHPLLTLAVVLVGTMFLSDLMNNAATAVVMAPIAISLARGLELSPDPFLMAVAVGASCAFLTPIGHQSNTLVMGPGGYRFGDYWRVGLPLEALITVVAVPLIAWAWPLQV
jgi:di/tricarboxylate transporter